MTSFSGPSATATTDAGNVAAESERLDSDVDDPIQEGMRTRDDTLN